MDFPASGLLLLPLLLLGAAPGLASVTPSGKSESCLLPMKVGPCRAHHIRYYYDRYTQRCTQFVYGGCRRNANNFLSLEECEDACWRIEKVRSICRLELSEQNCNRSREQYFFNMSSMACEPLTLGTCNSNANGFPDEGTCVDYCTPKKNPSLCYTPKDSGPCSANETRYYFNARKEVCEEFKYSGCGGNENNFYFLDDCQRVCKKVLKKGRRRKLPKTFTTARKPRF